MREDIIYLTLYLITEMANYLLAYRVIFQAEITKDKRRWGVGISSLIIIHLLIMIIYGENISESLSIITMIMLPICILQKREKKYFIIYPFIVIGTSNIMVSMTFLCALLFKASEFKVLENDTLRIFCQCIPIILMLGLEILNKRNKKKLIYVQLGRQQYILFYIGIICTYLMISALQVISKGNISKDVINICGLAISIACIVFIFLILWQGIVVYREIQYKERCEMNEKYLELQAEHFQQLMAQDEKMRKFRHDMNSHMNMLKYYCESKQYEVLTDYLSNMTQESAVYDVTVYTRNSSVDAVIAPLALIAQEKNIEMEWKGILPEQTKVALYDLCTIVSNLLKNAIEACEEIAEEKEKKIEIRVGSYNNQIYLSFRNTVEKNIMVEKQRLVTSKRDKDNHGIGSQNVKEAVQKYDGTIIYKCEDGWFEVKIGI
ncbi:GHKL domain-containing protein [Lachnospiraceae bacterium 38-14]|uniref:GHKL domain-containing protein n=1 Tax=Roseburia sp. 1XD42-69 TaxID=2320088 RepID=UPI000EA217E9|nr:GHKL domain-containing protein [Roseburia sp. 1XD42-69]MCX4319490.1 GHKL domain-containing protein [Lachnospiraceae bacterium]RKJ61723.1 GHKL domain-containing protein [Roseburia sp. 1XD42-69]